MKILIISDGESVGGATIAANRLSNGLADLGHDVVRVIPEYQLSERKWSVKLLFNSKVSQILKILLENTILSKIATSFCFHDLKKRLEHIIDEVKPDIINFHNIHGAEWPISLINECTKYAPVCWTLHDMWSFTGNFYTFQNVPTKSLPENFKKESVRRDILDFWNNRRVKGILRFITPSDWLLKEASKSPWNEMGGISIKNGLPLEIYKPICKYSAKNVLGLKKEKVYFLLAAANINEFRKGIHFAREAFQNFDKKNVELLVMGSGHCDFSNLKIQVRKLGYISDEILKATVYSAADCLVHPAPEDNLPNTVAESMACGTPVISYAVGGLTEMILPGSTGEIAEIVTIRSLESAIERFYLNLDKVNYKNNCRKFAEKHFDEKKQGLKYIDFFNSLL